jgi:hypothetical protein
VSALNSVIKPDEGSLRIALKSRVVIADGAMGTMIQAANPSLEDFQGHEGCNEILNVTRPELIADIHRQYLQAGVDSIETNTFGANVANLGEHGIPDRIYELAKAGAEIARIRSELNFGREDSSQLDEILGQGYRGSRYSYGYPACPDLEQQIQLCQLLQPDRIGVSLSEEFQLHPEQSTSAIIVHHPEAKYFNAQ